MSQPPRDPALDLPLDGLFVEASAGTGKTFLLSALYLRLLLERAWPVERILVVTFTNAATAELRQRLRRRLREALSYLQGGVPAPDPLLQQMLERVTDRDAATAAVAEGLQRFDRAPIATIHGFCQRLLAELAIESGSELDVGLSELSEDVIAEHVDDELTRELERLPRDAVEALRSELATLDKERRLVARALDQPSARIGGVPRERPDLATHATAWSVAAVRLGRALQHDKDSLIAALMGRGLGLRGDVLERRLTLAASLAERPWPVAKDREELEKLFAILHPDKLAQKRNPPSHPLLAELAAAAPVLTQVELRLDEMHRYLRGRLIESARGRLDRWRREHRVRTYSSLIHDLAGALRSSRGSALVAAVGRQLSGALIDEFQDTDPDQYEIFSRLFVAERRPVFLIGDPKQAIYSFRGADVYAYLDVARQPPATKATLTVNHRAAPRLVAALNHVYTRVAQPFLHPEIAYHAISPADRGQTLVEHGVDRAGLRLLWLEPLDETNAAVTTARDIAARLAAGITLDGKPAGPGAFAILTRTKDQARLAAAALRREGVPSVLYTDESVFSTEEAIVFQRLVAALARPRSAGAVRGALITIALGVRASELDLLGASEEAWETWSDRFARYGETWAHLGFLAAFRQLLGEQGVAPRLLQLVDGERRLTNLNHLAELAHRAAYRSHLSPERLLEWVIRERKRLRLENDEREQRQVRLETDEGAVRIITVHRSKGLEYPIVYCPFLWGGAWRSEDAPQYHDPDTGRVIIQLAKDVDVDIAEREAREEAMRLTYVALTRGKHQVNVMVGANGSIGGSPLGYLLWGQPVGAPVPGEPFRRMRDRVKASKPAELEREVAAIVASSGGAITMTGPPPLLRPLPPDEAPALAARRLDPPRVVAAWRSHSFTSLTRGGEADVVREVAPLDEAPVAEGGGRARRGETLALFGEQEVTLAPLPRGTRTGDFLHRILERTVAVARPDVAARTAEELRRVGLTDEQLPALVTRAVADILATPLDDGRNRPFRLGELRPGEARAEVELTLPIGRARLPEDLLPLFDLAPRWSRYRAALARLPAHAALGYLRGFIDLVLRVDGRYYVVDYKSNDLGTQPGAYPLPRLEQEMQDHHYVLQLLLYSVALHRHLRRTLPDYDPERHFGGAYYLFLRGMSPIPVREHAVLFDRPSPALLDAIDRVLSGGSP